MRPNTEQQPNKQQTSGPETSSQDKTNAEHYLEVENRNEIPKALNLLHIVGALLQIPESIFLFAFSSNIHLKWLVFTNYPVPVDTDLAAEIGGEGNDNLFYAQPESKFITSLYVPWITGAIVLLSALDHIFTITPRGRQLYNYHLARNKSPFRWFEYAISCSLMNVHMTQMVGVTDLHIISLIFVLSISIQYPAYIFEVLNAKARNDGYGYYWSPFFFATIPYGAAWGVIASYYMQSVENGSDPPYFVFTTLVTVFTLEGLFPVLFVLQWLKIGPFENYINGEYGFIVLGIMAKSALAWITVVGSEEYFINLQLENESDNVFAG